MRIINMGRRTEKTMKLINTAAITGYPILCRTNNMKRSIRNTANNMGALVDIYTYEEFKNIPHKEDDRILLDECYDAIGDALDKYFGCKVVAGTLTCPVETPKMETKEELHMSDFEFSRYLIKSMQNGSRAFDREVYDAAQNYIMDHLDDLEEKGKCTDKELIEKLKPNPHVNNITYPFVCRCDIDSDSDKSKHDDRIDSYSYSARKARNIEYYRYW